jgi:SAM-dependent methyltransferase
MRKNSIIRKIYREFLNNKYETSVFNDYQDYLKIQYRCEPKEFLDPRIRIISSFVFILPILENIGISKRAYHEEGITKGQLIENKISILDAGSRDGWTVEFLNSLGYSNVVGVELLQDYVDYCRTKGRNVVQGDLDNLEFDDDYFDFVYCRHVLEHCLDPIVVLSELMRITKKNGALYCSLPLEKVPHGKHTTAIPRVKTLFTLLKKLKYYYKPIYIGMAKKTTVIPEGNEAIIFVLKR